MSHADLDSQWPAEYQPNWETLQSAKSEDVFGGAAFELFKETGILTTLAAGLIPSEPMNRDDAILCGLLVKACKLGKAIVAMSTHLGSDRQLALLRELIEALATLRYLLDDPGDGSRFTAYVLNSSVAEREFLKIVERNVADRGTELPIEASMTRSIRNTTASAGIDDASSVPGKKRIGWPSAETLVNGLGGDFYLAYRGGSSVLHSQWADLIRNHLVRTTGGHFVPSFDEPAPRPQPLYAGATLLVITIDRYLTRMHTEALELFRAHLSGLEERLHRLVQLHGAWLDARTTGQASA
jgi:hypothetical protein